MAASATLALKAGVWFRRARLVIISPDSRAQRARCQAETPLIVLCRFPRPALTSPRFFEISREWYSFQFPWQPDAKCERPERGWSFDNMLIRACEFEVQSRRFL